MLLIFVIQLENGKYYIGKTYNPKFQLENYLNSNNLEWTKIYKPLKLLELKKNCDDYDEDKITRQYMDKYGINNGNDDWSVETKPVVVAKEIVWNTERINVSKLPFAFVDCRTMKIKINETKIIVV